MIKISLRYYASTGVFCLLDKRYQGSPQLQIPVMDDPHSPFEPADRARSNQYLLPENNVKHLSPDRGAEHNRGHASLTVQMRALLPVPEGGRSRASHAGMRRISLPSTVLLSKIFFVTSTALPTL